jgi:hypothetical protein
LIDMFKGKDLGGVMFSCISRDSHYVIGWYKRLWDSTDFLLTIAVAAIVIFFPLSENGWAQTGKSFSYNCQCEAGVSSTARLQLDVQGTSVSGSLQMAATCGANIRDYGISLDTITATLKGKWEAQGSSILGTYTGRLIACDNSSTPRTGSINLSLSSGGQVVVKLKGHYYNNYTCKPTGIVYDPNATTTSTPSTTSVTTVPGSGSSSGGKYGAALQQAFGLASSNPIPGSLGPPRKGFDTGPYPVSWLSDEDWMGATYKMDLGETRAFNVKTILQQFLNANSGSKGQNIKKVFLSEVEWEVSPISPYSVLQPLSPTGEKLSNKLKKGELAIVKAVGEGLAKVFFRAEINLQMSNGEWKKLSLLRSMVFFVLVGNKILEDYTGKKIPPPVTTTVKPKGPGTTSGTPPQEPSITVDLAVVKGKVVRRSTNKPVPGAIVELNSTSGRGSYGYQMGWQTNANGEFLIRAEDLIESGIYSVIVRKPSTDPADIKLPGPDNDLWPVREYRVNITKETAAKGPIDAGTILMDTVKNIYYSDQGQSSGKGDQKIATQTQGRYNPLSDPNLKAPSPIVDPSQMDKFTSDFQKGQWSPLDQKEQKIKDQQTGQAQSPDYLGKTSTATTSTGTSGDSTTTGSSGSTNTADKTGIEVVVVGEAPPGKCRIVEGQLVPVKGYKENISGMTITLTGPENKSVVSSGSGAFSFPEIQAGDYVVSVKQWDYGMTKQSFAAPSGKSVKIVLKGSCPYLYVWDGEGYQQENDIYSVARLTHWDLLPPETRLLASREGLSVHPVSLSDVSAELRRERSYRDYYKITKPLRPDGNGQYRLQVREQAAEYSWTDLTGLLAVDHAPGRQVAVTRQGDILLHGELRPVNSFADVKGKRFSALPDTGLPLYNGEGMVFDLPKEAFSSGLLEVRWQGFQDGTAEGHEASQGVPRLRLEGLDPEGNWRLMDYGYPRDEIQRTQFLLAPGSGGPMTTRVRLVAESCVPEKYHRIDGISWGKRMEDEPRVHFLNLLSAKTSEGEDVTATLESGDGQSALMGPGESLELWFTGAPLSAGDERSFVFVSEGAYMPMPYMNVAAGK